MPPKINRTICMTTQRLAMDATGQNNILIEYGKGVRTVFLQLQNFPDKKKLGTIYEASKTMLITRDRARHLFQRGQAYGFNAYLFKNAKTFTKIQLIDEYDQWLFPVSLLEEKGRYLNFKQQGFERQLFLSLDDLKDYKIPHSQKII